MRHSIKQTYVEDIQRPKLTESHRKAIRQAQQDIRNNLFELSESAILRKAYAETGLSYLGSNEVYERLRFKLHQAANLSELSPLYQVYFHKKIVQNVTVRLRLEDLLQRNPQINTIKISNPIIILGLPRSGSSHLHELMACDNRLRSIPMWELDDPIPAANSDTESTRIEQREKYRNKIEELEGILPYVNTIHPMGPDDLAEDLGLVGSNFPVDLEPHRPLSDMLEHYKYLKNILKAMQWLRGPNRWILKTPRHALFLKPLLATFPDASIVMTHRDPIAVVQSGANALAYFNRIYSSDVDMTKCFTSALNEIRARTSAMLRDHVLIPEKNLIHVHFKEFLSDRIGTIENIKEHTGIPLTSEGKKRLEILISKVDYNRGRVTNSLERNFGVAPNEIKGDFETYAQTFSVINEL